MPSTKKPASGRNSKKVETNFFSSRRNQVIILLVVMAAALAVLIPVYQKNQAVKAEKQDFLAKQQQLEQIADNISAANKPDERNSEQSCRYQSAKFEKGDLYCTVKVELAYSKVDLEKVNQIHDQSSDVLGQIVSFSRNESENFTASPKGNNDESLSYDLFDNSGFCSISYYFDTGIYSGKSLKIFISCKKVSNSGHFPLEK